MMNHLIDLDIILLPEGGGRDEEGLVSEKLITCLRIDRPYALHGSLKTPRIFLSYTIPLLWRPEVVEIDTVKVDVLQVPCESGFPHSQVQISRVNPRDFCAENIK